MPQKRVERRRREEEVVVLVENQQVSAPKPEVVKWLPEEIKVEEEKVESDIAEKRKTKKLENPKNQENK
mgnify:CR=1 FL=1